MGGVGHFPKWISAGLAGVPAGIGAGNTHSFSRLADDFPVPALVRADAAEAAISAKTIQLPCDALVCDAKSNG